MASRIEELKRFKKIIDVLLKYGWEPFLDSLNITFSKNKSKKAKREGYLEPEQLRLVLEDLGGTFVKLGQLLSLRPDLLPREYLDELEKLQDEVGPVPFTKIKKIVEEELGDDLGILFSSFQEKPLSSASVSQVHEATLEDGTRVAVKVQRPEVQKLFEEDIAILKHIARLAERHMDLEFMSPKEFVKEFEEYTLRELNFKEEGANIRAFHAHFSDDLITKIPRLYSELTSRRVLTMEYIDGIPIHDHEGLLKQGTDPRAVAVNLAHSLFTQIFVFGEFHADPHPGNVFALKDHRIALLDLGIIGRFSAERRKALRTVFLAILTKDLERMTRGMKNLNFFTTGTDIRKFQSDIRLHMRQFYNVSIDQIKLSEFLQEVLHLMRNNKLNVPLDLVLLVKALFTLEGTCRTLDPEFNPITTGKSFLKILSKHERDPRRLMKSLVRETMRFRDFLAAIPYQAKEVMNTFLKADEYMASLNRSVRVLTLEMDRSSSKLAEAMIISGLLIASAFLVDLDFYPVKGISLFSVIGFVIAGALLLQLFISAVLEKRFLQKLFNQKIFKRP